MKAIHKWEDISHSLLYTIQLLMNKTSSEIQITVSKTNQYPSLYYESSYSLTELTKIHSSFTEIESIESAMATLYKIISNNQINIIQGSKSIILSLQIPTTHEEAAFTLNLNTSTIDKDALIEELTTTVGYLNCKIEALTQKINHLDSNTVKLDQFNEMIRRIERVSTGLPSYNSIFVNPSLNQNLVNRFRAMTSNDILINIEEERNMICQWIAPGKRIKMTMIYKASYDSFTANTFHTKCDYYPKTLVLIKTEQGIRFGGYTEVTWNNDVDFKADNNAFLFSIERMEKYPITEGTPCAIYCRYDFGPTFGEGFDLCINDNAKHTNGNYSNFPTSYGRGFEKHALTSGNVNFNVIEIEVYQIEIDQF